MHYLLLHVFFCAASAAGRGATLLHEQAATLHRGAPLRRAAGSTPHRAALLLRAADPSPHRAAPAGCRAAARSGPFQHAARRCWFATR